MMINNPACRKIRKKWKVQVVSVRIEFPAMRKRIPTKPVIAL